MERTHDLYVAYSAWCERNGRKAASKQKFSADLMGAFPELKRKLTKQSGEAFRAFYGLGLRVIPLDTGKDG